MKRMPAVSGEIAIAARTSAGLRLAVSHALVILAVVCETPAAAQARHDALAPAGVQAAKIAGLWHLTLIVCTAVFVAVLTGVLVALLRGRRADSSTPPDLSGNTNPERRARLGVAAAAGLSVVLLVGLTVADVLTDRALSKMPVADPLHIELTGWQWWWQAHYTGGSGQPGFVSANELHVPIGRPIVIALAAGDVIHSFWVPNLHGKKDLLPGVKSTIELRADEPGTYRGPCAEFCGAEHALMSLTIVAEPPTRYAAWAAAQRADAVQTADPFALRGMHVFLASHCASCHTVRGTSAKGLLAPDLTHLMSRSTIGAGALPNTPENLLAWVRDPQAAKPGVTMPATDYLSDGDVKAVVAWLETLK